jgi:quinol monooxygenase YgiN
MIVVAGYLLVDPSLRERALELSLPAILAARAAPGCIDFAVSADPMDPSRINVCERWAGRESLERFRGDGPGGDLAGLIHEAAVEEYEV